MGIFARLAALIKSNLNDLISRSEDPEKMLNQIVQEMSNQLLEAKRQVAESIADEKRLAKQVEQETTNANEWERRAMLAIRSGDDALAKLESVQGIDLVLTDVEMPVMDGLELTRRIRAHQGLKDLAVVAITSLSSDEAMRRGRDAGLDGYIVKLDREKILESVEKFLAHGRG